MLGGGDQQQRVGLRSSNFELTTVSGGWTGERWLRPASFWQFTALSRRSAALSLVALVPPQHFDRTGLRVLKCSGADAR